MKSTITAVDFGTSKIVALVAETSGRQRCDIVGAGNATYDGYANAQWNSPALVNEAIKNAMREAAEQSHAHIRDVVVGVPGEFCRVYTVEAKTDLQGADPHVTPKDIEELFVRATTELGTIPGVIIHRSPAWFMVDDGKKTLEPRDARGYELRGMISFVVADQFFLDDVSERFRALGYEVSSFMSTATGQAMLYIPDEERDRTALLIDVGYLNTEVMAAEGDALIFHQVLPIGGGNIAADVAYGLDIPLSSAEQIKRAYAFGTVASQPDFEVTGQNGTTMTFSRDKVAEILEPRVEEIADSIKECIERSGVRLGSWSASYLTGGGLAINRGGRDFLAGKLNRTVRELPRKAVKLQSPAYASALGLLDLVIDTVMSNTNANAGGVGSFFRSLFGG